jgi:hypothetical protein
MKIKKVVHHGRIRWRVNDPHGTNGKRQRKFFETKEAAERLARQKTADSQAYGIHFVTIPPSERATLGYQLERLRKLGWNLPAAVNFIERHGKAPPSILLGVVATEFLAAKKAAGLRPRYLRTLKASIICVAQTSTRLLLTFHLKTFPHFQHCREIIFWRSVKFKARTNSKKIVTGM